MEKENCNKDVVTVVDRAWLEVEVRSQCPELLNKDSHLDDDAFYAIAGEVNDSIQMFLWECLGRVCSEEEYLNSASPRLSGE